MAFFEGLGVKLKTERGSRVFPVSDRAADIVDALFFELRRQRVEIRQDRVTGLAVREGQLSVVRTEKSGELKDCKVLILATGGASYPRTGSTGDGYRLAREAGHAIVPIRGSLVPLESEDPCCARLQGLSLRNVELRVRNERGKTVFREQGELLFTHFGLSGPLVLSASAHMDFAKSRYAAHIDLKPALSKGWMPGCCGTLRNGPTRTTPTLWAGWFPVLWCRCWWSAPASRRRPRFTTSAESRGGSCWRR